MSDNYDGPQMARMILRLQTQLQQTRDQLATVAPLLRTLRADAQCARHHAALDAVLTPASGVPRPVCRCHLGVVDHAHPELCARCGLPHREPTSTLPAADAPKTVPEMSIAPVLAELERAMHKFPTWPTDPLHALAVLGEEFGELTKAVLQLTYEPHKTSADEVRSEAIQTAAMGLRFAASLDRYEYRRGEQHSQAPATTTDPEQTASPPPVARPAASGTLMPSVGQWLSRGGDRP